MDCSHELFFSSISLQEKCGLAKSQCTDFDMINFMRFTYCGLDGSYQFYIFIGLISIILLFKIIQVVVEEYMAPAIQYIAQRFQLPDSLCAITLLALVNGAGDLVTAFVASTKLDGLQYNIGAIYGAGLFVCSVIIGTVIIIQEYPIDIQPQTIYRDVGTYIFSSIIIICFGIYGQLSILSSIFMFSIYICLVLYIGIDEYYKKKSGQKTDDQILRQALVNIQLTNFSEFNSLELPSSYHRIYDDSKSNTFETEDEDPIQNSKKSRKLNIYRSINKLIELPIKLVLYITLPNSPSQDNQRIRYYKRTALFLLPASIIMYIAHTGQIVGLIYVEIILPITLLLCILIYITQQNGFQPKYYTVLQFVSIYISLGWTYIATDIIIDILQAIGIISNLNKAYLGVTIISIGNALPDAVTTIALAKQGQATLGVIGSYTGQLFGLLIGFGVGLFRSTLYKGPIEFKLFGGKFISENIIIFATIGVLILTVISIKKQGALTKRLGLILILGYCVVFTILTIMALSF